MSPLTAGDTGAAAQVQEALADLLCADPDLVRTEFDAIIEANWGCAEPPASADDDAYMAPEPRPNPWVHPETPDSTGNASVGPPHASGWARLRSPPDQRTLYFETDAGDGFRESGFSKERRLEPQITIGLLTDAAGFPLMVNAFEGNAAETTTMLPSIRSFMAAHRLDDVTIVADAGMVSAGNQRAIEAAGLSFILGARIPDVPYVVKAWRETHPDTEIPDGHLFTQPWPASPTDNRRDQVIYYQYRADRARRTLRGIDEQVAKAEGRRRQDRGEAQPVPGREELPDVQARPSGPADLPPPA